MSGCDKQKATVYTPGDLCWIIVDDVNSPTGTWFGEVLSFGPEPWAVRAKIIDSAVKNSSSGNLYFGKEPYVNYSVIPDSPYIRDLLEKISFLKNKIANIKAIRDVREKAFMEAFAAIGSSVKPPAKL